VARINGMSLLDSDYVGKALKHGFQRLERTFRRMIP
jgi:hypothetical protein